MMGFPLTLPLDISRPRRWSLGEADRPGAITWEDGRPILLQIEVTAAEAPRVLQHLTGALGTPAHADYPGIDEVGP